jgi:hypothetical protein
VIELTSMSGLIAANIPCLLFACFNQSAGAVFENGCHHTD